MHPTRSRLASRFLLLGLIGLYGGAFLFPLSIADQIVYARPTPSFMDALLASWPMLAVIGFGVLLLWISHKLDPLTGANRDNLRRVFRGVASVILFIMGMVGIASALLVEVINVLYGPYRDDTLRSSTPSAIMLVAGIVFLWLSRLASGKAGPVLRYPLNISLSTQYFAIHSIWANTEDERRKVVRSSYRAAYYSVQHLAEQRRALHS